MSLHNELGTFRRIGSQVSVAHFPDHWARRIMAEFDPGFRPLWTDVLWEGPNGGLVRTGHHVLARYVPHATAKHHVVNILFPTHKVHGVRYRGPIVLANTLDGLTDQERNRGALHRYEPFTAERFERMRAAWWKLRNVTMDDRIRKREEAEAGVEAAAKTAISREATYRKHNEGHALRKSVGAADSVFVSDTLRTLREAGGVPMEVGV